MVFPQAEQVFRAVTSFNALPAICLWRFFMWDVFFLGTARRTDSQMSETSEGIGITTAGRSADCHRARKGVWRIDRDGAAEDLREACAIAKKD